MGPELVHQVAQLAVTGHYDEALQLGDRGVVDTPCDVALRIRMARLNAGLRDFDAAYRHLNEAESASQSQNATVFSERARLDAFSARDSGQTAALRAIELNPDQNQHIYYLAGHRLQGEFIILNELGLVYSPIPKSGSTSVKSSFLELERSRAGGTEPTGGPHKVFGGPRIRADRLRLDSIDLANFFSFTVVRDDVQRFESYHSKNVSESKSLRRRAADRDELFGLPTMPDMEYLAVHLREYQYVFADVVHHTLPSRAYLHHDPDFYDRVFSLAELNELTQFLSERTGIDLDVRHELQSEGPARRTQLSDLAIEALRGAH